jgi:8-oxo-dGTP pyrophosphatase MutT (NUDIX family)
MADIKEVLVGVITKNNKYLLIRRSQDSRYDPGRWEFISLMVKDSVQTVKELRSRIKEETNLTVSLVREGDPFSVKDEYGEWLVRPFLFNVTDANVELDSSHVDYKWVKDYELKEFETVADLDKNLEALGK